MTSIARRVAARYEFQDLLRQIQGGEAAILVLVTSYPGMDIRVYPTEDLDEERLGRLSTYIAGIFTAEGIEDYGPCDPPGGAALSYRTQSAWKHIKDALLSVSWEGAPFKLLLNPPQPSIYPDAERHHIVIDSYGDTFDAIKKVLLAIQALGDAGHSTSVDIDGEAIAGIDGDGSDRIEEILVDDVVLENRTASMVKRITAKYKSKKKVETKDGDKVTVYQYSDRQIALRNRKKAERLEKLKKGIGNLRKRVQRDLKSDDPTTMLTALAVGLIDHTYERVGNEESADEGHFGVTGWQRKHISFGRGKATVRYVGKSGVKHEKKVSDANLIKALKDAYESNDDDEGGIFSHDLGKVDARKVNEYLKQFDVTAKDLRGFHANREMHERLTAIRAKGKPLSEDKKAREKQLKTEFLKALEETAEAVGHEPATLRSQYLVPGLEEDYMADGRVDGKFVKTAGYCYDRR
jgi:hypothetical protein